MTAAGASARAIAVVALLIATGLAADAAAGGGERAEVRVASTGNDSERRRTLPITRAPGARPQVVMSMGPGVLPDLARGDRLRLSAELQTTNNCNFRSPRCVGRVYHYAPRIRAQLLLAPGPGTTAGGRALHVARPVRETCTQKRPDYEHHCVLTFAGAGLTIRDPGRLPCRLDRCRVNLVADAHSPRARAGDLLMIGGQRPNGTIPQDRGRINAVRLRATTAGDFETVEVREPRRRRLRPDLRRRVVYSQRLDRLEAGEQLEVSATLRTGVSQLRYAVRTSVRMILADSPRATRQGDFVKGRTAFRGEISENNGSNCTQDDGTCVYRKVGVEELRRAAVDRRGRAVPLFVNLVAVVGPKVRRAQAGDRVIVRRRGGIEVRRYPPGLNPAASR
ncbi:MAG TPA: hypothetical protein VD765_11965 [Solirubrobacterales bacterium]|nr:hypothetical protein [Solirubrobacterales bacterium]